jgi:hypothetical protein
MKAFSIHHPRNDYPYYLLSTAAQKAEAFTDC